ATGPGAQTDQGLRQRLTLIPAQQQSAQYAEMVRKLNEVQKNESSTDVEASQAYNQAVRIRDQAKAGATPAAPGTPGAPGTRTPGTYGAAPGAVPSAANPQPGVKPPGTALQPAHGATGANT